MTAPNQDGSQFKAEAQVLDAEEQAARDILERKHQEREAKKALAEQEKQATIVEEPVDPEDDAVHMDLAQNVVEVDGDMFDKRNDKLVIWNDQGLLRYAPEWPHRTVTYKGTVWEYRDPKKLALMFMGASSNTKTSPQRRMGALIGFLEHTLSERSLVKMQDRAFDYEDDFDTEHMGRLMQFVTQKVEGDQDQAMLDQATEPQGMASLED